MMFTENVESNKNSNKVLHGSYHFMPLNLTDSKYLYQ